MDLVAAGRGNERDTGGLALAKVDFAVRDIARDDPRRAEELLRGEVVAAARAVDEMKRNRLPGVQHDRVGAVAVAV